VTPQPVFGDEVVGGREEINKERKKQWGINTSRLVPYSTINLRAMRGNVPKWQLTKNETNRLSVNLHTYNTSAKTKLSTGTRTVRRRIGNISIDLKCIWILSLHEMQWRKETYPSVNVRDTFVLYHSLWLHISFYYNRDKKKVKKKMQITTEIDYDTAAVL